MKSAYDEWRKEHREEVAGNGRYPLDPEYIAEFLRANGGER
jgi:hypothetical protein